MCFSASSSLILSGALFYLGSITVAKVHKSEEMWFAYIPYLFAVQQANEGILWLTNGSWPLVATIATYIYTLIAFVVWPTWMPYSIYKQERKYNQKDTLFWFYLLGLAVSGFFLFSILRYGVQAKLLCNHIYYHISYYSFSYLDVGILYLIPVIIPFFITTTARMKILGFLLLASCIISFYVWYFFFTSIWCFFAALLSLGIFLIV